jgi:hypothetical protein
VGATADVAIDAYEGPQWVNGGDRAIFQGRQLNPNKPTVWQLHQSFAECHKSTSRHEALLTTGQVIVYEVVTNMRQVLADRSERYHPVRTGRPIRHARRFI